MTYKYLVFLLRPESKRKDTELEVKMVEVSLDFRVETGHQVNVLKREALKDDKSTTVDNWMVTGFNLLF